MYGPLLMLIICVPLFLIALFWAIAPYRIYKYYDGKLNYADPKTGEFEEFRGGKYECLRLEEAGQHELLAQLKRTQKKENFWYKAWSDYETVITVCLVIIGIAIFVFGVWSIAAPLDARTNVAEWEEFATIANDVFTSSTNELERAGVVNKMLEYNEWLAEARASQRLWGNWSAYYNIDLPEPLLLP